MRGIYRYNVVMKHKLIRDLGSRYPRPDSKLKKRYGIYACTSCGVEVERRIDNIYRYPRILCEHCKKWMKHAKVRDIALKYKAMIQRCENPNDTRYKNYGGRGIFICDEWQDYIKFETWSLDNGYKHGLTIDRIDNDKGYEPSNCRYTNMSVQLINKRHKCSSTGYAHIHLHPKNNNYGVKMRYLGKRYEKYGFATIEDAIEWHNNTIDKYDMPQKKHL